MCDFDLKGLFLSYFYVVKYICKWYMKIIYCIEGILLEECNWWVIWKYWRLLNKGWCNLLYVSECLNFGRLC